jgi:hypothetical protein
MDSDFSFLSDADGALLSAVVGRRSPDLADRLNDPARCRAQMQT